ncbi:ComEA family DNA-binding protein [Neisseriaceae bacterium CLB008]
MFDALLRRSLLFYLLFSLPLWANVNINLASETELSSLSGIGPAKAQAIVAHRLQYGAFTRIEDIQKVKGIGPVLFQRIKDDINVNAQTPNLPRVLRGTQPQPALKKITPIG